MHQKQHSNFFLLLSSLFPYKFSYQFFVVVSLTIFVVFPFFLLFLSRLPFSPTVLSLDKVFERIFCSGFASLSLSLALFLFLFLTVTYFYNYQFLQYFIAKKQNLFVLFLIRLLVFMSLSNLSLSLSLSPILL